VTVYVQKHPKLIHCCSCQSVSYIDNTNIGVGESSLLVCACLVNGWCKLWASADFLDDNGTIPDFRGFSVSHEK
jgi:hypothetical protein